MKFRYISSLKHMTKIPRKVRARQVLLRPHRLHVRLRCMRSSNHICARYIRQKLTSSARIHEHQPACSRPSYVHILFFSFLCKCYFGLAYVLMTFKHFYQPPLHIISENREFLTTVHNGWGSSSPFSLQYGVFR